MQTSPAEDRQRAYSILAELIEINTTNSERGDTTAAARALERRFLDAGFPAEDVHVVVPNDAATKSNVIARYRGRNSGSPDIKVGRSPGRSDQELCDLGRNRLIHGFFWDLPEQYFLASVDGRLRRPRSGWGACSAAAKSRRKVLNLWLLLDDRWAGDTAQVVPVR